MYGSASKIATIFVQEKPGTDLGVLINDELSTLAALADVDIIDIKYASANDEDGCGWYSALIIYKQHEEQQFPFDL